MKTFSFIFSMICYILAIAALVLTFVCAFAFTEKPTTGFYVTMALSIVSLITNGSVFMWHYHDN